MNRLKRDSRMALRTNKLKTQTIAPLDTIAQYSKALSGDIFQIFFQRFIEVATETEFLFTVAVWCLLCSSIYLFN